MEDSSFVSIESLASLVALTTLRYTGRNSDIVTVRAAKPKALVFAEAAEVEIVRTLRDYDTDSAPEVSANTVIGPPESPLGLTKLVAQKLQSSPSIQKGDLHTAAIALGSNLGDSFANIELALRLLEDPSRLSLAALPTDAEVSIVDTSFLYETAPMYVTDQPKFINGACIVRFFHILHKCWVLTIHTVVIYRRSRQTWSPFSCSNSSSMSKTPSDESKPYAMALGQSTLTS